MNTKNQRILQAKLAMNQIASDPHAASVLESRMKGVETPRAKYHYRSGNVLLLPKQGLAPMLFLEFVRDYRMNAIQAGAKYIDLHFNIHTCHDESEEDYFHIRIESGIRQTYEEAVSYINANL